MTPALVIRDLLFGLLFMAVSCFVLVMAGAPMNVTWLPGGIGIGFYLAAVWVDIRYE